MDYSDIKNMDIYLLDLLFKGLIPSDARVLDAGCGRGRNSEFFIRNNYKIYGLDISEEAITGIHHNIMEWNSSYPTDRFATADLTSIPFDDNSFDLVISSAVLHFAQGRQHFIDLFNEHVRVLSHRGLFWFRMTTKHTIEGHAAHVVDDIYDLPDGTRRYLLDQSILEEQMDKHNLKFAQPWKTVNVSDVRTMSVILLGY